MNYRELTQLRILLEMRRNELEYQVTVLTENNYCSCVAVDPRNLEGVHRDLRAVNEKLDHVYLELLMQTGKNSTKKSYDMC